jgi:hypothetical protein
MLLQLLGAISGLFPNCRNERGEELNYHCDCFFGHFISWGVAHDISWALRLVQCSVWVPGWTWCIHEDGEWFGQLADTVSPLTCEAHEDFMCNSVWYGQWWKRVGFSWCGFWISKSSTHVCSPHAQITRVSVANLCRSGRSGSIYELRATLADIG